MKTLIIPKSESIPMRIVGFFSKSFMRDFWTTYRMPFQKEVRITYPDGTDPSKFPHIIEHEMYHAKNLSTAWGLFKMFWLVWAFPLPIIFSGRWFIERHAYLNDIKHGYNLEAIVDSLWCNYGLAWPRPLMRRWFKKMLKKET